MKNLEKEQNTLEEAATQMQSFALKAGAERAEVCATYSQKTKIALEKQDYHLASSDQGYDLGLRVTIGQQQGFTSCNSINVDELKEIALRAVEITGFAPKNPYQIITRSENIPTEAPRDVFDDELHQLSLQTQKEWTQAFANEAIKDPRFRLNEGAFEVNSALFLLINSKGTHKLERETVAGWTLMGMAVEDQNITSFDYFYRIARKCSDIPEQLIQSAREFCTDLIAGLKTGPGQSYKGLVVFTPRAVLDIFVSALAYHLNGRVVVEKTGRWQMETLGTQVLNEQLTLEDLPWLTDRSSWSSFDREGTPTKNLVAIQNGKLKSFFLDQYAAQALSSPTTGNAAGGPTSIPAVSAHCLCLQGGTQPLEQLLKDAASSRKEYLVVHRFSGNTDPITGDFSGVAKGADWYVDGTRSHTVKETMISGNLFNALGSGLVGISKEVQTVHSSEHSPTLVADGVSVTSG